MTVLPAEVTYQATDLARRSRDVLDAARRGGALIRDKDGTAFEVVLAGRAALGRYVLEGIQRAVRALRLLEIDRDVRDALLYGDLAWMVVLPDDAQRKFVWEYVLAVEASIGIGVQSVEQLVYEWQQTARIYADAELLADLTEDIVAPLTSVEL